MIDPKLITQYVTQNVALVFRLFHENNLVPKKAGVDYGELLWAISDSPLGWDIDNKDSFEHLTHLYPQYEMRSNFRVDKHLIRSCHHPYISIGNHHEHNSVNIKGTIRTQTRFYRRKHFNEHDWTFLNYVYAPNMDYDDLQKQVAGAFQPEVLRRFIKLEG